MIYIVVLLVNHNLLDYAKFRKLLKTSIVKNIILCIIEYKIFLLLYIFFENITIILLNFK